MYLLYSITTIIETHINEAHCLFNRHNLLYDIIFSLLDAMEIELIVKSSNISMDDYIIRKITNNNEEHIEDKFMSNQNKRIHQHHFQGKLKLKKWVPDVNAVCVVEYFEKDVFLGIDQDNYHIEDYKKIGFAPISIPLNIPDRTTKMIISICDEKPYKGFYYWTSRTFVVGIVGYLLILISKSLGILN